MNIDDLLGKLVPLFEKKMELSTEMSKRAMSLEEKKEASKVDLEYRKLDAQITSDKDKLRWEKEKLVTTIKGGYDLEVLKNSGMMDQERLKNLGAKERVEIDAASKERIAKGGEDARIFEAKLKAIPDLFKVGTGTKLKTTDPNTGLVTEQLTPGNAVANQMGMNLGRQSGIALEVPESAAPQRNNTASQDAAYIKSLNANGQGAIAGKYFNTLPDERKAELSPLIGPDATPAVQPAATPVSPLAPGISPVRPASIQPAVPPVAPATEPVRPAAIQTVAPSPEVVPGKSIALAGPLDSAGKTSFGGTPGGVLGDVWNRGSMQAGKIVDQRKIDEEKAQALRRARGVNIGGNF